MSFFLSTSLNGLPKSRLVDLARYVDARKWSHKDDAGVTLAGIHQGKSDDFGRGLRKLGTENEALKTRDVRGPSRAV